MGCTLVCVILDCIHSCSYFSHRCEEARIRMKPFCRHKCLNICQKMEKMKEGIVRG